MNWFYNTLNSIADYLNGLVVDRAMKKAEKDKFGFDFIQRAYSEGEDVELDLGEIRDLQINPYIQEFYFMNEEGEIFNPYGVQIEHQGYNITPPPTEEQEINAQIEYKREERIVEQLKGFVINNKTISNE